MIKIYAYELMAMVVVAFFIAVLVGWASYLMQ